MVETIIGAVVLLFIAVASVLYFMDRTGWNATILRASKIVRSHLPSKTGKINPQLEKADWEAQFSGKPVVVEKHKLVKTWMESISGVGDRAHAKCLCGHTTHVWVLHGLRSTHRAQYEAKDELEAHAKSAIEAERNKELSGGNFEF